jgi:hypothetical protein
MGAMNRVGIGLFVSDNAGYLLFNLQYFRFRQAKLNTVIGDLSIKRQIRQLAS